MPHGKKKYEFALSTADAVTKRDYYPLLNLQENFDYLGKATLFSSFDVRSSYHQIDIEESVKKTAFSTLEEHWEYNKMPFGLVNSPSAFQRFINVALSGLTDHIYLAYLDDIIVFSI